jgi:hypothetical protein
VHDVDYAPQLDPVHAADRARAERIALQGHDRRGGLGQAERPGQGFKGGFDRYPVGVRDLLARPFNSSRVLIGEPGIV